MCFSRKFKLPDSILDFANIKVIAMVIDNSTGEIMNATSVKPALAGGWRDCCGRRVRCGKGRRCLDREIR